MEIEIKLLLEPEEAGRLEARLGPPVEVLHQWNRYFDDPERRLGRAGWGLRLRRESTDAGTRSWLTLKHRGRQSGGFSVRPEYERSLDEAELQYLNQDPEALSAAARALLEDPGVLPEIPLQPLGELVNRRYRYRLPGLECLTVEVDHTVWPDGSASIELELEVEREEQAAAARSRLAGLFEELGVRWRAGTKTKLARLVEMLDRD
jgi:uncharacterized protein YjbK